MICLIFSENDVCFFDYQNIFSDIYFKLNECVLFIS